MTKRLTQVSSCLLLCMAMAAAAWAQGGGEGSLRGTVTDDQGGALPGVTVTATSPQLITPAVGVTDGVGQYRLAGLPPGTYTVTAELSGFSVFRREGILMRAGATFQVDIPMALGTLSETVTVSGESPMLEVARPANVLNIDGEFLRQAPLVEGKSWIDFLQITPGVMSRPQTDSSGRQNYFGNAVDQTDNNAAMEGLMASTYNDTTINRTGLSTEAMEDVEVKTGGVEAASPMGYGLIINMVGKSGGNQYKGSAGYTFLPFKFNSGIGEGNVGAGSAFSRQINQADFSFGGPIKRDRVWVFGALRNQDNRTRPGRTETGIAILKGLFPTKQLDDTLIQSLQPFVKVTAKLGENHTLSSFVQRDRLILFVVYENAVTANEVSGMGGGLYGGRLTSSWGRNVTTSFTVGYNNKNGNNEDSYQGRLRPGPFTTYHQTAALQQGRIVGSGGIARDGSNTAQGCTGCELIDTATVPQLRGDLTWFKTGGIGSHQFQTGFLVMPNIHIIRTIVNLNDGFIQEERRLIDPNNAAAGSVAFHRQYASPLSATDTDGTHNDLGLYVQDSWRPTSRLTMDLGIRVDFVRRFDEIHDFQIQKSNEVGPRAGFSFLVTKDAKNVLRGTFARMHEQMEGSRHAVGLQQATNVLSLTDTYDVAGNGSFSAVFVTPAVSGLSSRLFQPGLSQPQIDENIIGFRHQFPGQMAVDVAGISRVISKTFQFIDINGFYPDGPGKPFLGFGKVDPNLGVINQLVNNFWSTMNYQALQVTLTKNMSHRFQALVAIHRQWQHADGEYSPTDPARFIQPDSFENNHLIDRTRGGNAGGATGSSYPGGGNGTMWAPFSYRMSGTFDAGRGVMVSASFTDIAGLWSGAIVKQIAANDPDVLRFGTATVVSSTGSVQSNPLATRIRFVYPTQGEGQVYLEAVKTVGMRAAKRFNLGTNRNLEVGMDVLNLLNAANGTNWASGANRQYSPATYLQPAAPQTSRSIQLDGMLRF